MEDTEPGPRGHSFSCTTSHAGRGPRVREPPGHGRPEASVTGRQRSGFGHVRPRLVWPRRPLRAPTVADAIAGPRSGRGIASVNGTWRGRLGFPASTGRSRAEPDGLLEALPWSAIVGHGGENLLRGLCEGRGCRTAHGRGSPARPAPG